MTITAHLHDDATSAVLAGDGDPNRCPACLVRRSLCGAHLERMRADAAEAAVVLAVMEAERDEALYLMDRLTLTEAGL